MSNEEKTDPGFKAKAAKATARADPWADRFLLACQRAMNWAFDKAVGSALTPWVIVAVIIGVAYFGYRIVR
jgi:hypothetical protein